jgi:single-stranded-DNA-specific exonuclease
MPYNKSLSYHWQISPLITPEAEAALAEFNPALRQILFNRGYATPAEARAYLAAQPPSNTDPFTLLGIPQAVERILTAIARREPIAVYGDYDADGVTATALLVQTLHSLQAEVRGYIPNRFDEGYGLNTEALDTLHAEGVRLVITVDCGIRSLPEIDHARSLGLDMIISDHHHPGEQLPDATAVIDPKQPGDPYPEKNLAGVGLAYKLACALLARQSAAGLTADDLLDLVAVGTVADLVPLVGENRALVRAGLERIRKKPRQGLYSLMAVAGVTPAGLQAFHIGYMLAPRINAAGRMDSAQAALDLLLSDDPNETGRLAQLLDNHNRERQQITRQIQEAAEVKALADERSPLLLFAADPDFNPGVVGLAASRLSERYYRPAIVAHQGVTYTRGSCRSIPEFHITAALDQCAELLEHHGGHAAAAGFTVLNERLPELIARLQAIAQQELHLADLRPVLLADTEVNLYDLNAELLHLLAKMQPTGYGNRQATFVTCDLKVTSYRTVGREGAHLKLVLTDGWSHMDAIGFNLGDWAEKMPTQVDVLYTFEENEFNGQVTLQLNLRDLKPAGEECTTKFLS